MRAASARRNRLRLADHRLVGKFQINNGLHFAFQFVTPWPTRWSPLDGDSICLPRSGVPAPHRRPRCAPRCLSTPGRQETSGQRRARFPTDRARGPPQSALFAAGPAGGDITERVPLTQPPERFHGAPAPRYPKPPAFASTMPSREFSNLHIGVVVRLRFSRKNFAADWITPRASTGPRRDPPPGGQERLRGLLLRKGASRSEHRAGTAAQNLIPRVPGCDPAGNIGRRRSCRS